MSLSIDGWTWVEQPVCQEHGTMIGEYRNEQGQVVAHLTWNEHTCSCHGDMMEVYVWHFVPEVPSRWDGLQLLLQAIIALAAVKGRGLLVFAGEKDGLRQELLRRADFKSVRLVRLRDAQTEEALPERFFVFAPKKGKAS